MTSRKHLDMDARDFRIINRDARETERAINRLRRRDYKERRSSSGVVVRVKRRRRRAKKR